MKNFFVSLALSLLTCSSLNAQFLDNVTPVNSVFIADGYYRTCNLNTKKYVSIVDNYGDINMATTSADLEAIKTFDWDIVCSDPGSIVYVERKGQTTSANKICGTYVLSGQGTSTYEIINHYLGVMQVTTSNYGNTYQLFAQESGNIVKLIDELDDDEFLLIGQPCTKIDNNNKVELVHKSWYVYKVDSSTDCYFGVNPTVKANGMNYATMYADFGFTPAASAAGMKVYYVDTIWEGKAVIREINGEVPANTPVIFLCPSDKPTGNRLDIAKNTAKLPSANLLEGVFFCMDTGVKKHRNYVEYDPETMRVLGVCQDGKPGFVKMEMGIWKPKYWSFQPEEGHNPIPANSAYLKVPAGSPDELPLLDYADYPLAGISGVEADSNVSSDIRTLSGVTVRKNATTTEGLSSGIYIWNNKKVVVK